MGIPHENPGISAIPNQQYHARETTSQYYGVYWNKQKDKWCGEIRFLGKKKYARCFKDKLDAAKSLNQLCEDIQIPHKNPGIGTIPNQKHVYNQIVDSKGVNPVISSEIDAKVEDDKDSANENKRKREKGFIDNFPIEKYYFYDSFLK